MGDSMIERYRSWFEYERQAHARVLDSLASVPVENREMPEYRRAVEILAHMVAARRIWLERLGVLAGAGTSLATAGAVLDDVAKGLREVEERWAEYLAGLDDAALVRSFEYQSTDAGRFRNRIDDILAQLFGHSWYHRGQIAMLVRAAGGQPAVTDLIYFRREPLPDA